MSNSIGKFKLVEYAYYNGEGDEPRNKVETTVVWDQDFGRCNRQTFSKQGEIYTRARFRAWLKKYSPYTDLAIADQLPTSVWWEGNK